MQLKVSHFLAFAAVKLFILVALLVYFCNEQQTYITQHYARHPENCHFCYSAASFLPGYDFEYGTCMDTTPTSLLVAVMRKNNNLLLHSSVTSMLAEHRRALEQDLETALIMNASGSYFPMYAEKEEKGVDMYPPIPPVSSPSLFLQSPLPPPTATAPLFLFPRGISVVHGLTYSSLLVMTLLLISSGSVYALVMAVLELGDEPICIWDGQDATAGANADAERALPSAAEPLLHGGSSAAGASPRPTSLARSPATRTIAPQESYGALASAEGRVGASNEAGGDGEGNGENAALLPRQQPAARAERGCCGLAWRVPRSWRVSPAHHAALTIIQRAVSGVAALALFSALNGATLYPRAFDFHALSPIAHTDPVSSRTPTLVELRSTVAPVFAAPAEYPQYFNHMPLGEPMEAAAVSGAAAEKEESGQDKRNAADREVDASPDDSNGANGMTLARVAQLTSRSHRERADVLLTRAVSARDASVSIFALPLSEATDPGADAAEAAAAHAIDARTVQGHTLRAGERVLPLVVVVDCRTHATAKGCDAQADEASSKRKVKEGDKDVGARNRTLALPVYEDRGLLRHAAMVAPYRSAFYPYHRLPLIPAHAHRMREAARVAVLSPFGVSTVPATGVCAVMAVQPWHIALAQMLLWTYFLILFTSLFTAAASLQRLLAVAEISVLYGFMLLVFTDVALTAHVSGQWLPAVVVALTCLSVFELPLLIMGGKFLSRPFALLLPVPDADAGA